jgi:hypothetical protein
MKKNAMTILLVLIYCGVASTQTIEIEKKTIFQRAQSSGDQAKGKELMSKWAEVLKETGGYPEMPYDEKNGKFMFKSILSCKGFTKKQILTRLKEFVSLRFGKYDAVVDYYDEEAGKLIVKGFFEAYNSVEMKLLFMKTDYPIAVKVNSTYVFTVKDGIYKLEILGQDLTTYTPSYSAGNTYIPSSTTTASLSNYFPITSKDVVIWKGVFNLMHQILKHNDSFPQASLEYIIFQKDDYAF